jgi:outer membrane protein assembly factor BamB
MSSVEVVARGCCPQCGGTLPLGRGGGTVTCSFCNLASSYVTMPKPTEVGRADELDGLTIVPLHPTRNAMIVGWASSTLEACDPGTGRPGWQVQLPRARHAIVTSFERVYLVTETHDLVAVDSASGRVAFAVALPGPVSLIDGLPCIADVSGPAQPRARVLVHAAGQVVALDRMSGALVESWQAANPPRCWAAASGYVIFAVGPAEVWLVDPMRKEPVARVPVSASVLLDATIASGHAFVASGAGEHAAIQLSDGAIAWRAAAPWNPATRARAAFARELFLANADTITMLPSGKRVTTPGTVDELAMIAATVVARAGSQLVGYQRTLAPAWSLELREFAEVRMADNGRMLVLALMREDQLWLRGLLPTSGKPRWNVLVPEASKLVGHAVVGDLVMVETDQQRFVLRADTGQVIRSSRR